MGALPKIISVASGKGGVGKTNVTLNLAWALARLGRSVCLFDADLGLSNVDVLLGISPQRTLDQVLFEGLPLSQVITPVATGIDLVPGSSGVARMAELTRAARTRLVREFAALSCYDYVLVDNSPGISPQVLALCLAAQELVVVVNPEVTSLTDSYALIKVLHGRGLSWPPLVLINRAQSPQAAELAFRRIQATAQKHLKLNCTYLGYLPEDVSVARASALQRPVLEAFPQSAFAQAVVQAAGRLAGAARLSLARAVEPSSFWDETVRVLQQTVPASARTGTRAAGAAPEAQTMMRDVEAVRALFMRLDFKGAPEPLRRIAEAGKGHAQNLIAALERIAPGLSPLPRPAPAQKAAPQEDRDSTAVLVRCANQDMGQIVADILREMRLTPLLSTNGGTAPESGRAALCILAAPEETPAVAAYLKALDDIPVLILDESFGRNRVAWLGLPGVRAVLPVPFEVPEFIHNIETLLHC
ncbi:MAG: MinD/ParA family protein [Deltaproteobacteria bacterium HGW-Deltaproteobacteria-8]|nr:MAG: MinD/ParA family protein [Deltaproteobacteria bacterium HGW-Deltaproteobacteria-8]